MTVDIWSGYGGGAESIEINNRGYVDSNAIEAFTRGQCHALAFAIQDLTGWPVYGYSWSWTESYAHLMVKTPDDKFLDIRGIHKPVEYQFASKLEPTSRAEMEKWYVDVDEETNEGSYLRPNIQAAMPYAKTLLHRYYPKGGYTHDVSKG